MRALLTVMSLSTTLGNAGLTPLAYKSLLRKQEAFEHKLTSQEVGLSHFFPQTDRVYEILAPGCKRTI